jgi:hypothetical protein
LRGINFVGTAEDYPEYQAKWIDQTYAEMENNTFILDITANTYSTMVVTFTNTGTASWEPGKVRLRVYEPDDFEQSLANGNAQRCPMHGQVDNPLYSAYADPNTWNPGTSQVQPGSEIIAVTLDQGVSPGSMVEIPVTFYADADNGADTNWCDHHFVMEYQDTSGTWVPMPNTVNGNDNDQAAVWWRIKDSTPSNPKEIPPESWIPTTGDIEVTRFSPTKVIIRSSFKWDDLSGFDQVHSGYEHEIIVTPASAFECEEVKSYDFTYTEYLFFSKGDQGNDCYISSVETNIPDEALWYVDTRWGDEGESKAFTIGITNMDALSTNTTYEVQFLVKITEPTVTNYTFVVQAQLLHRAGTYPNPYQGTGPGDSISPRESGFCEQAKPVLGEFESCMFVSYIYRDEFREGRRHLLRAYVDVQDIQNHSSQDSYYQEWNKRRNEIDAQCIGEPPVDPSNTHFANAIYDAAWVSQKALSNNAISGESGEFYVVRPEELFGLRIRFNNKGSKTWCSAKVNGEPTNRMTLSTYKDESVKTAPDEYGYDDQDHPDFGKSWFHNGTWLDDYKAALLIEDYVEQGRRGTFVVYYEIPSDYCDQQEDFREDLSMASGSKWVRNTTNGRDGEPDYTNIWVHFTCLEASKPFRLDSLSANTLTSEDTASDQDTPIQVVIGFPVSPDQEQVLTLSSAVTSTVSSGTFNRDAFIFYKRRPVTSTRNLQHIDRFFNISAFYRDGTPAQPAKPYTITVEYSQTNVLSTINESDLALYHWDGNEWTKAQTSTVDIEANKVTAVTDQMGIWGVLAEVRQSVTLDTSHPITGHVGVPVTLTAYFNPTTATTPITYTWQATDQDTVLHTGALSDTVDFIWNITGTKTITVTASNGYGEPVTATHSISIALVSPDPEHIGQKLYLPLITR